MIRIGFYGSASDIPDWQQSLAGRLPDFEIVELMSKAGIDSDVALVWAPPRDAFSRCTKLRGIIMQGQGVDHMMRDETVPRDIPLVRLVDPDMANALSHWAILNALDFWRDGAVYRGQQSGRVWKQVPQRAATGAKVGILGVGAIGTVIARRFAALGFEVRGYARTMKQIEGVEVFAGPEQLADFASGLDIVVSVLPLTPETTGMMNAGFFAQLAEGAFVINGGRGPQVHDEDLLEALESGRIGGAALDVFAVEPLPQDHPYWTHPKVRVWPHVAAQTNATSAADQVAAAILAMVEGRAPANRVDWSRGY
ncbi:MAG: 2-hydroxyacid dehydrogenase [Candidatus Puniceispirillaceae bacterium]